MESLVHGGELGLDRNGGSLALRLRSLPLNLRRRVTLGYALVRAVHCCCGHILLPVVHYLVQVRPNRVCVERLHR